CLHRVRRARGRGGQAASIRGRTDRHQVAIFSGRPRHAAPAAPGLMPRAFVGIFLSEQTRRTVSAEVDRLRPLSRAVAWVAPNNLHVTLRFLGDQTEEQLTEIVPALEEAVLGIAPFTMGLRGLGAFPALEHPRTLWVGIAQGSPEVRAHQPRVARAAETPGVPHHTRAWASRA